MRHVTRECLHSKIRVLPMAFKRLDREVVGIAPGCGDSLGPLRNPARAAPAEAALTAAPSFISKTLRISRGDLGVGNDCVGQRAQ